ncbi:MAG: replication initiation factor domain-containing protein [Bacteroides sp.]|nr:replication initiation factor domain-containing protein [Eubacterium sp.]MCM1417305.1 replication initiation factor domain-containing protein [Roseburia sp.]MCM1461075.1 replication initiation factor domain-containing protein [Bacteroides sp.]
MEQENCILIDWFAMSFRVPTVMIYDVIKALGLNTSVEEWEHLPGRYYYRDRLSLGHISIYYNNANPDKDFPLLEMTGQGCREFETYNPAGFKHLFELAKDTEKYHMSRLDVSFDDFSGIFDIQQIYNDYRLGNWVSTSNRGMLGGDMHRREKDYIGYSIMTGSKSSDMYMRIYDKAIERGYFDGRHWIRCELVLKQDRATVFIKNPKPLGEKYRGVLLKYFRFVEPNKLDSNKSRWAMQDYWSNFLGVVESISVFTPKNIEYNLPRLHHYVMEMAGNSVDTYIRCVGLYDFFDHLLHRGTKGLTMQQRFLVRECDHLEREKKRFTVEELEKFFDVFEGKEGSVDQSEIDPESSDDPFENLPIPEPPSWDDCTEL